MRDSVTKWIILWIVIFEFVNGDERNLISQLLSRDTNNFAKYDNFNPHQMDLEEYDFVIVGSGAAGSILANRLTEVKNWKILILEAGNFPNELTKIPTLAPVIQMTPYNWGHQPEPQEGVCLGMNNNVCPWPRGRAVGGSTAINYMIYTRGHPEDYRKWEAMGNPGWSYEDVWPYFLKSEQCRLGDNCLSDYHNRDGFLSVEYPYKTQATDLFLEAGLEMGNKNVDCNSNETFGFAKIQANLRQGRRESTASAFLLPILHRKNLNLITFATATKILVDPNTKTAYGVKFNKNNRKFVVKPKKEVILSGGTFNSPQLLMLSGIGPKKHLEELNIPVIQDLPVGETLYDHIIFVGLIYKVNITMDPRINVFSPLELLRYFMNGEGVYHYLGGIESLAFIKTNVSSEEVHPDIELILSGIGSLEADYGMFYRRALNIREDFYNQFFRPIEKTPCIAFIPTLLHAKSKGNLKLRSKNPFQKPKLRANYFTDHENVDMRTLLAGIRYAQKLAKTKAFQKIGATLYDTPVPYCKHLSFDSDDYWLCALRSLTSTIYHQSSTCKMGPGNDSEAVVDSRLRVHGIKNLRVSDCSVIPVTISGHTSAPTMMVAEKTSDILKEDWNIIKQ